ncbi:energy-coupling factor transport system substrate-specific component [Pullulanibacillus pueri]|uniref:ECF transporter S component n=1 Tax=Pullulanibacillus pueri TaxID=1437324 RepID=A0A8J3EJS1_9BACL|nr:ECF transporter S component [Pullulanibacillus pueri]MBM7680065.1 energy-coupling factor transport system substrate-specific component [Pullulanibacillus pueri]GGH74191.1 hypothetical protein GCM10007096_02170 [Pullulanibacillus pueri]
MAHAKLLKGLLIVFMLVLFICGQFLFHLNPLFISFLLILLIIGFFILRFELRKIEGRELVLLAVLAAIAAVSRVPFASIPSVQPTTFVVIMTGMVFGAESGFVVGALAALVSNLFLGQGPWTPWQMLAWGTIGLIAGALKDTWMLQRIWGRCIYGVLSGFFFGWVMNLWALLGSSETLNLHYWFAFYSLSFYFDGAHALSNVFFITIFSHTWLKILGRFKKKYGLLS